MRELYVITGICGHVGNNLARLLTERGERVRGLALPREDASMLDSRIELVRGDVRSYEDLLQLFEGIGADERIYVVHCAGIITVASGESDIVSEVNINGTDNVIRLCSSRENVRLVHISTVHAIPEKPKDEEMAEVSAFDKDVVVGQYAKTKAVATQHVLDAARNGLDAVVVHPAGIIGPDDYGNGHTTQLVLDYLKGLLPAVVHGGYNFVDVRDVALGIIAAAKKGRAGECYILSGTYHEITEILDKLHEITGEKPVKRVLPLWFVKPFLPLASLYFKLRNLTPLFTKYSLYTLSANSKFSHSKASRELDYKPRSIDQTLKDTVESLKKMGRWRPKRPIKGS